MHLVVQSGELSDQRAPQVQRPDITLSVPAGILLDRFDLAFFTDRFPNERLYPVEAVDYDRLKFVLLILKRTGARLGVR